MILKFTPILKTTLWGGEKIVPWKALNSPLHHVGESWEISGVEGNESVVSEGEYKGTPLNKLVAIMGESLIGKANYERFGNEFPLLIKFIDAQDDLSIQVHPDDATAKRLGKPRGKTEMWYVLPSDPGAFLHNGLRQEITPEEYKQLVATDTICDALARYEVSEGDSFFIPSGRIHSIGRGCFVAEIQQTSDVTFRIYDFNRVDRNGQRRELHTEEAAQSVDYHVLPDYRIHYTPVKNEGVELVSCPHFTTALYDLDEPMVLDYSDLDSFVILVAVKGEGTLTDDSGDTTTLHAGQTILLPATTDNVCIEGNIRFLETFI